MKSNSSISVSFPKCFRIFGKPNLHTLGRYGNIRNPTSESSTTRLLRRHFHFLNALRKRLIDRHRNVFYIAQGEYYVEKESIHVRTGQCSKKIGFLRLIDQGKVSIYLFLIKLKKQQCFESIANS